MSKELTYGRYLSVNIGTDARPHWATGVVTVMDDCGDVVIEGDGFGVDTWYRIEAADLHKAKRVMTWQAIGETEATIRHAMIKAFMRGSTLAEWKQYALDYLELDKKTMERIAKSVYNNIQYVQYVQIARYDSLLDAVPLIGRLAERSTPYKIETHRMVRAKKTIYKILVPRFIDGKETDERLCYILMGEET